MMHIDLQVDGLGRQVYGPVENEDGWQTADAASLQLAELAPLRQALYRVFGALFLYPTPQERTRRLCAAARELTRETQVWAAYGDCGSLPRMLENLLAVFEQADVHTEEEYNRLFQVKPAAPPYESFYLDREGQARAWITRQLEHEYAQAGLALSPSLNDLPDHIAVELEFMSFLCGEEERSWQANDEDAAANMQTVQRTFMDQHLGQWFPQFARRTIDAGPKELYNGLINTSYVFLRRELDLLRLRTGMRVS